MAFLDDVIEQYHPTYDPYQAYDHPSGHRVMKYSAGQAVIYTPFFLAAHAFASVSEAYPADGFSRPYQFMMSLGSLVIAFLGLYWLHRVLREYFRPGIVGMTLLLLTLGTNYLNYAAIDGAMTHSTVFSLYALLLLTTHRFYLRATFGRAALIGVCVGLAALTRPTEILAALIPLLWGLDVGASGAIGRRLRFLGEHYGELLLAAGVTLAIGAVQLLYWQYVTGEWVVYSYQDQGFDWLAPHLNQGFFSYKAGWLIYTPLMALSLLGFYALWRHRRGLFAALFVHALLFIYVAFAWSVWWYGGSLGQRTMVQAYAPLSFPLAAFLTAVYGRFSGARSRVQGEETKSKGISLGGRITVAATTIFILLSVWHNLYWTHQAHRGGLFVTEQMTAAYFWRVLYTFDRNPDDRLALDTSQFAPEDAPVLDTLYQNNFETDNPRPCANYPISGQGSLCLKNKQQNSPDFAQRLDLPEGTWLRASVRARVDRRRDNKDNYAQMIMAFRRDGREVRRRLIRLHRVLNHDMDREVHLDSRIPNGGADEVIVWFWNGGDAQPGLVLDELRLLRLGE